MPHWAGVFKDIVNGRIEVDGYNKSSLETSSLKTPLLSSIVKHCLNFRAIQKNLVFHSNFFKVLVFAAV